MINENKKQIFVKINDKFCTQLDYDFYGVVTKTVLLKSWRYLSIKDNGIEFNPLMIRCKTHHVSHTKQKWLRSRVV